MQRIVAGLMVGALGATAVLVAPAFGASEMSNRVVRRSAMPARGLGGFTPAAADPRLAAVFARGGLDVSGFRFTPADTRREGRAFTVAVRTQSNRAATSPDRIASTQSRMVGLSPIAYNLGVAVGWKRFAVSGDVAHVDLAGLGGRDAVDVGVSYTGNRFSGRVKAAADRPVADAPKLIEGASSYSLDVGGSYALSRNLDLTAGVRYRTERERLARLSDDRRDSQAVYLGTAFRF